MKLFIAVAVIFVFLTTIQAQVRDPRCEVPSQFAIVFPHPTNCEKFMKCEGSYAIEMYCPWQNEAQTSRLHFNADRLFCDWPWSANCA